jgi:hypothetical protein
MNHGRLDVSSIKLCATQWTFALPRNLNWREVRANPPKIQNPEGRYFIHCIQHWIIRFPRGVNRFRKFDSNELDQETVLVDNYGQIYTIYALSGLSDDWGVRYFEIKPDDSTTPLTPAQVNAVKDVHMTYQEGMEYLPSVKRFHDELSSQIRKAIADSAEDETPVQTDILAEHGVFDTAMSVPRNPAPLPEPEPLKKRILQDTTVRNLKQAYIDIQHARDPQTQKEGQELLVSYLKSAMPKQFHKRIEVMNRTMLSRKLMKYYEITFPKSTDKALPLPPKTYNYPYYHY